MRKPTLIKALAFLLSFAMLMTGLPAPSIAESVDTSMDSVVEQTEDIVIEDDPVQTEDEGISEETDAPAEDTTESPAEDEPVADSEVPTEDDGDAVFPEDDAESDITAGYDAVADPDPSEGIEEPAADEPVIEDDPDPELPVEPLPEEDQDGYDEPVVEDTFPEDDYQEEGEDVLEMPILRSAANPLRFNGTEAVRLGKESSNIGGIIVQKNGSSSTSIARHWVTVDGVEYTAFCIEASDASTSGRDGGLEPGSDAGLLWILNNVPDSSDEDYAIKQQAVWAYLGQSFSIQNLAAGSRCSMSTDQLRARLTEIVTNAQSATLSGSQELWIAYHLENRSYYQDMAFTVAEPPPTVTPTPTPVPTPTPTPVPVTGTIQVVKRDSATGAVLVGAVFQLYDAAGYPVGAPVMTNGNGVVAWGNLPLGNYSVQEIAAPEGYNCDNGFYSLTLTENNLFLTMEVVNSVVYGKIRIIKTDADTQAVLAGAVFEVTDAYGTVATTLITGTDGTAESDWLPYGSYTVTETQAASGYINSGFSTIVNVTEHGQTYTIGVENVSMQGGIRLTKTDADTGKPISGVQFDIYDANGTLVGSMTTNENGVAMSPNLPRGQYTVKEHALPTGYTGELVELTAYVEPNAVTDLTATNTPITSRIKIIKTDAVTGKLLPGAVFSVTDDAGYTVATITTGADGIAITDWLPYGRYKVSEVQAPDRYINSGFSTTIYAEEDGRTYTVTVENSPMQGGIRLTKTDSMTGTPIAGVEFGIYDTTGTLVASMTTDASGVATAPSLSKGSYIVREHGNPTGYVAALAELSAEVVSDENTDLYVTNDPIQGRIRIVKKDAVTGDLLSEAEFSVTRISGIPAHHGAGDGEIVATITTNAEGIAESPLLTYGTYRIEETEAPAGFLNSGFTADVMISEDNLQTIEVVVENEPMAGGLRLTKTDSMTGTPIAGVQFDIYDANGTLVVSMTTDANGVAEAPSLTKGSYTVREHGTPDGYVAELVELQAVVHSNETADLTATNTPIQGRIRIVKKDALNGDLLAGAEFSITQISGIPAHHGAGDGEVVATITTDTNGVAESPLLTYGTYRIDETVAPTGYVNSGYSKEVSISEDNLQTIEVVVENEAMTGGLRLTKTDSQTGAPIECVKFNIFQGDTLVATMTTDEKGIATCDNLNRGTYIVKEDSLPEGYTGELVVLEAVVQPDAVTELHATNTKSKSRIRIIKTDALTGERLPGAEFTVTDEVGNVFAVITDENGEVTTDWLPYGVYTVRETMAPEHYVRSDWSERIAAYENGMTYTFEVSNVPTNGYIRLAKTDSMNGMPISGVQFDIFDASGYLVGTMTTDESGVAVSPALPKGSYTVCEHENPVGYVASLAELSAVVHSDETTDLAVTNDPIQGKIRIVKKDQLTGDLLAGAEFTISRISGIPAHGGADDGELVATMTTDANGVAESPLLTYGTYRITETMAPDHFVLADFSTDVTISEDNMQPIEVVVENEPTRGYIRMTKTDSLAGMPIAGVQFDIFDASGDLAGTMTTDENGVAVSPALTKGNYTLWEHENPIGYVAALAELPAVVYSDETTDLAVTNDPIQGKIRIVKKDQLTGDLLAGAEFTITRLTGIPAHEGAGDGEMVATITTDANGVAESPLLTYGTYKIEETVVPEHFVDNGFSMEVTISDDNLKTYEVVVENEPAKGWLKLTKTNSLDGHPIAGVTFNVYYYDDYGTGLACTMTTDENGVAVSPALRKGRYLVQEEDEPVGYVHDLAELTAIVNPDEITELSVTNEPIQGILRIRKLDELTGEALAGAEFTVTRISGLPSHNGEGDGEVVAVITTDANGSAVTPLLSYGLYKVEETKVPPHFVDNDFSTEMVINEENFCTYEITVENEPTKGWLRLTKTDRENGNPIAGVVFDVYYADQYGQGLATTMVTDANGVAMSEPLRKGQYTVQERGATEGYVFEQVFLEATVHSDETTELTATNQPVLVQLKLYKRDVDEYTGNPADTSGTRGDGVLTSAEFQMLAAEDITDRQGNVIHVKGDVVIASIKTAGADASVTTDKLWPGLYQVVELTPPIGYQPSDKPIVVDARDAAKQSKEAVITYEGVITNEIKYGAQAIVKLLGDGTAAADPTRVETPEPDAEFRVYLQKAVSYDNARDIERDYLVTDANGYAMTKALPYGVYVLEQVKGKEGYEIKGPITFEIDGTESIVNPPPLTLSDQPILYRLKFIKTDSITGKTITLSNASFKLKDANGEYVKQTVYYPREQVIDTFTTDDTGSVTLPETVTWGLYFVEEVKAPEGYLIRTESLSVFVGHEGDLPGQTYELEIEIPNDPVMGRILLDKKGLQLTDVKITTDTWDNEVHTPVYEEDYLAGAVFEIRAAQDITGKDGTVWYQADDLVDTITTTANGSDASKELPLGKYNVIEVTAPAGYFIDSQPIPVELRYLDSHGCKGTIIDDYSEMEIVSSAPAYIEDRYAFLPVLL